MSIKKPCSAVGVVIIVLGLLSAGPAYSARSSQDLSTGIALGAMSVAVPIGVIIAVPAVVTGSAVAGVSIGSAQASGTVGEFVSDELQSRAYDQPLPIAEQTLMVGPSPAEALRGAGR